MKLSALIIVSVLCSVPGGGELLFRVSPGGDGVHPAGLWGGGIAPGGSGREVDLFAMGYGGLGSDQRAGLRIDSASYDTISQSVLLLIDDSGQLSDEFAAGSPGSVLTAAYGPLCNAGDGTLQTLFLRTRLVDPDNPYLMDSECGAKCGWGPFAAHNSKVYFVLSGVFGRSPTALSRQIQLRVLEGCEDELGRAEDGVDAHDFDVVGCSRLLAVLHTENYEKPKPRPSVWTTSSLSVFMIAGDIHLFLQMFDTAGGQRNIKLMRYSLESNRSELLYTTAVQESYTSNLRVRGSGSVDYKNGVLCWTATDRLLCSLYALGHTLHVISILGPGDAVRAGICTGSLPSPELANYITGVAVADTDAALTVYFGCYSEIAGIGGVGKVSLTNHGLWYTLSRVTSGPTAVYGGSLFITTAPSSYCPGWTTNSMEDTTSSSHATPPRSSSTPSTVNLTTRISIAPPTDSPSTSAGTRAPYSHCTFIIVLTVLLFIGV